MNDKSDMSGSMPTAASFRRGVRALAFPGVAANRLCMKVFAPHCLKAEI